MTREKIYVIVPVYNEGPVVRNVIQGIRKQFGDVICVNDGSSDNSSNEIQKAGGILIEHPINLGAGAATQTGVDYALRDPDASFFVTIDADGQHNPKDAVKMLAYLKKHHKDIVFGSRFMGTAHNISRPKKIFLSAAKLFSKIDTGIGLTDPHIGLKVFNRKFAENLKLTFSDFAFASEMIHRIKEGSFKYDEVPVTVTYTEYSKQKGQSSLNAFNIAFDMILQKVSKWS